MVDTIFNGGSSILASWHSKQSIWHQIVKANSRAPFFQELFFKKSTNSIKFPSASCKFWLHWSLSPYKLKYAEDLAFWILEALQKTNTPKFHKFKANYLSKRGLKWLTQILSWFSPKNEGSVAPISKHKQKCTQALVTFQYECSRGLCNISPLSSDGNMFDTEIPIHFLWTKYLLIQMLNSNWLPSSIFYLLSAWLYRRKHKFFQPFFSSSFSLYKLSSVYHTFAQHRIISQRYSRLFEFHNERSGT